MLKLDNSYVHCAIYERCICLTFGQQHWQVCGFWQPAAAELLYTLPKYGTYKEGLHTARQKSVFKPNNRRSTERAFQCLGMAALRLQFCPLRCLILVVIEDLVQEFEDICAATDFDPEKVARKGVRGCERIICSTPH